MTKTEQDVQPAQDGMEDEYEASDRETSIEENGPHAHKSGVYVDPNAKDQSGRYGKRDTVHMSIIQSGIRTKGTFTILRGRLHASKAFYEYQLLDPFGEPYKGGAWIREKDLRLEKRSG